MKRMRDLKNNLRGVKCAATIEAFKFLKGKKRKPYLQEQPTCWIVRVTLDGRVYDYSPQTGAWSPTRDRGRRGRWRESSTVADFYAIAVRMSAGIWPPSQSQLDYLSVLESQTGLKAACTARHDIKACSFEIDRLKQLQESKGEMKEKPRISAVDWNFVMVRNQHENTQEKRA